MLPKDRGWPPSKNNILFLFDSPSACQLDCSKWLQKNSDKILWDKLDKKEEKRLWQ